MRHIKGDFRTLIQAKKGTEKPEFAQTGTIDEEAHVILRLFANYHDMEFREGDGWIEFPACLYGENKLKLGQRCALYTEEGEVHSILPVIKIEYKGQSVSALNPKKLKEDYILCRVRFSVKKKDSCELYKEMRWIISAPVTENTYSEALFWYAKCNILDRGDLEDTADNASDAFVLLVQEVRQNGELKCFILQGKGDGRKLFVYKRNGLRSVLSFSEGKAGMHSCTIGGVKNKDIEAGDVISDYALPDGYTFACRMDPKISWRSYVDIVKGKPNDESN